MLAGLEVNHPPPHRFPSVLLCLGSKHASATIPSPPQDTLTQPPLSPTHLQQQLKSPDISVHPHTTAENERFTEALCLFPSPLLLLRILNRNIGNVSNDSLVEAFHNSIQWSRRFNIVLIFFGWIYVATGNKSKQN